MSLQLSQKDNKCFLEVQLSQTKQSTNYSKRNPVELTRTLFRKYEFTKIVNSKTQFLEREGAAYAEAHISKCQEFD